MIVDSFNYFFKLSNFGFPSWLPVKNPCRIPHWRRGRRLSMAHHKSQQIHNSLEACEKDKTRCFGSLKTAFPQVFRWVVRAPALLVPPKFVTSFSFFLFEWCQIINMLPFSFNLSFYIQIWSIWTDICIVHHQIEGFYSTLTISPMFLLCPLKFRRPRSVLISTNVETDLSLSLTT